MDPQVIVLPGGLAVLVAVLGFLWRLLRAARVINRELEPNDGESVRDRVSETYALAIENGVRIATLADQHADLVLALDTMHGESRADRSETNRRIDRVLELLAER